MRLVCPECGAVASATAWENDAAVRSFMGAFARLPVAVSSRALDYLALFRTPDGARGLSWKKARRLASELADLVTDSSIQWSGKPSRPIDDRIWGDALEKLLSRPPRRLPLTSHGYLCTIAYGLAEEADRSAETARNASERNGTFRRDPAPGGGEFQPLDREWMEKVRRERLGGKAK